MIKIRKIQLVIFNNNNLCIYIYIFLRRYDFKIENLKIDGWITNKIGKINV